MIQEINDKFYTVSVSCSNCGDSRSISVPKGEKVSAQACVNCGCNTISKTFTPTLGFDTNKYFCDSNIEKRIKELERKSHDQINPPIIYPNPPHKDSTW